MSVMSNGSPDECCTSRSRHCDPLIRGRSALWADGPACTLLAGPWWMATGVAAGREVTLAPGDADDEAPATAADATPDAPGEADPDAPLAPAPADPGSGLPDGRGVVRPGTGVDSEPPLERISLGPLPP